MSIFNLRLKDFSHREFQIRRICKGFEDVNKSTDLNNFAKPCNISISPSGNMKRFVAKGNPRLTENPFTANADLQIWTIFSILLNLPTISN